MLRGPLLESTLEGDVPPPMGRGMYLEASKLCWLPEASAPLPPTPLGLGWPSGRVAPAAWLACHIRKAVVTRGDTAVTRRWHGGY